MPVKPVVGKTYKTRCGFKTGKVRQLKGCGAYVFEAEVHEPKLKIATVAAWTKDGWFLTEGKENRYDLTEETSGNNS